jgi:hypothetical protein
MTVHSSLFIVRSKDKERTIEKTKPICRPSARNSKSEYLNPKDVDGCVLKKQTQFLKGKIVVKLVSIIVYGIICKRRQQENKANPGVPITPKGVERRQKKSDIQHTTYEIRA